jgi:hypothetical protein
MAQIVAKAMAKGANVDKLAAEFADELDALGVRVAALEKKADNVKITGQFRYHYASKKLDGVKDHESKLRSRIWFTGKVNNNWEYVGMLENQQDLTNNAGDEKTDFQRAYLQGRLGGLKTVAGRFNKSRLAMGDIYGTRFDGVDFTYGKQVKLNAYYGKPTNANKIVKGKKPYTAWGVNAAADLGKNVNLFVGYDEFKNDKSWDKDGIFEGTFDGKDKIFDAGLKFKLGKNANFTATYLHADLDGAMPGASDNGFILEANYGGAKAAKVGSWGIGVKYYQTPAGALVAPGWETSDAVKPLLTEGAKGWYGVAKYTLAKNMIADVEYWDMKGRETDRKNKVLWSGLYVSF